MTAMAHGGHETIELVAAAVLVLGGAGFLVQAFRGRSGRGAGRPGAERRAAASPARSGALILAALSAGAAVIHLVAAPSHYLELGDLGAGFLVAAVLQAAWIRPCLAGPSRRAAVAAIAINGAIVLAWAWSRTAGLPVGPFAGGPEPVGFPDGAAVAFELLLVAGLVPIALGLEVGPPWRRLGREVSSIAIVPVVGLVLVLTSLATVAVAAGLDHGSGGGHDRAAHATAP